MLLANTYAGGEESRAWITDLDAGRSSLMDPPSLVAGAGMDCSDWSADGARLLCAVDADANPEVEGIYELTIATLELRRLTQGNPSVVGPEGECGGNDSSPAYSPDGTRFAFLRVVCGSLPAPDRDQTGALEVENLDGSGLVEVVAPGGILSHLGGIDWTDNEDWIAFSTESRTLSLVHPDGSGETPISLKADLSHATGFFATLPTWSPDGSWLMFSLYLSDETGADLYAATPDGENVTLISGTPDEDVSASWRLAL
jgi:Tol biopolymer transport system component